MTYGFNMSLIVGKEELLINKLFDFYSNPQYFNIFREIVYLGKHVSLRLLDFFSTNYSKINQTHVDNVCIHSDYKQHLKGYKKNYFDPFCRKKRILIKGKNFNINDFDISSCPQSLELEFEYYDEKKHNTNNPTNSKKGTTKNKLNENGIVTTVGQLNFFKWCIEKNVIVYVLTHLNKIEQYMADKQLCQKKIGHTYKTEMEFIIYFNN